jgi:putative heme-binding domain-containing protein
MGIAWSRIVLVNCLAAVFIAGIAAAQTPEWIWHDNQGVAPAAGEVRFFRRVFSVPEKPRRAVLTVASDNEASVLLNGKPVLENKEWGEPTRANVTREIVVGENLLAVRARNRAGPAALLLKLELTRLDGQRRTIVTDTDWLSSTNGADGWTAPKLTASDWSKARSLGQLGVAPWGNVLAAARNGRGPGQSTPAESLKVPDGFKVELLRSAQADEGSWVAMTADPKGRLIISPQDSQPMLRVTLGAEGRIAKLEPLDVPVRGAMGLLYAFDSLYVNGQGKEGYHLYRLRDTDGDDEFDSVELLRKWKGGAGEHGAHGIALGPDNKLYIVNGNFVDVPADVLPSSPHRNYADDVLLPRMEDGRGFGAGRKPPGGYIFRLDPDGKNAELFGSGQRNTYDIAFSPEGELFGFDSDMEWDWGTPWYRPIRVFHAVSGADHGFREGTAKWPENYPDSLPAAVNIGIGSPTGVAFGTGAKFPRKYQRALYVMDWSYGRILAVHLQPLGASYTGVFENFVVGKPLNVTDLVISPDGAMYFTVGGRGTQGGLYRVSYQGPAAEERFTSDQRADEARALRHRLEAFHGKKDPAAIDFAWPHLDNEDRFIRYAARIAIESQPVAQWQQRALGESRTNASLTALLALARLGPREVQHDLLNRLVRYWTDQFSEEQQLEALRVCEVAFIRMGRPGDDTAREVIQALAPLYPARTWPLNRELATLLIYLEAPGVVRKTLDLLGEAATQEEQVHYVVQLRNARRGWTAADRQAYFAWFTPDRSADRHPAETLQWFRDVGRDYGDGASFANFMRNVVQAVVADLAPAEREDLAGAIPNFETVARATREYQFVREWKSADLLPELERVSRGRSFRRGQEALAAAQCLQCHRFGNEGGAVGPDLTAVSSRFTRQDILESILEPSKVLSEQYQNIIVTKKDGEDVIGRLVEETDRALVIVPDPLTGEKVEVPKNELQDRTPSNVSPMPEGLADILTREDILDLLAYLESGGHREHAAFK